MPKVNKWTKELSKIVLWDPAEEGLEPFVDINITKVNHVVKRYLVENGHEDWCRSVSMTPYEVAKNHMTLTNLLLLSEEITIDQYKDCKKEEGQLFAPPIENPEELIETVRGVCTMLTELSKKTTDFKVGEKTYEFPEESKALALNAVLTKAKLPKLEEIVEELVGFGDKIEAERSKKREFASEARDLTEQVEHLRESLADAVAKSSFSSVDLEYTNERGEIPDGKVVMKKAGELFPVVLEKDFEVPCWEWDGEHPDVPKVDNNYIFRPKHLSRALYAILTNQREYIQGHTGSGKTTLVEQIAARLNWPFIRINFDSEITRMDLIGRDTLVSDNDGNVTSVFEDGMLPTAMSGPYICCFDELDFVRPDVAYVMQAALEGNGLRITEDGDRIVRPHPMFRMFGTGNTVGQGDEHGMYQGARPQSMAFLDRFTIWDKVEYLNPEERKKLLERSYPVLDTEVQAQVLQYVTEHLEAFEQQKVIQPISPRGMLAICQASIMLGSLREALEMSVLDRANNEDRATLLGLIDRVCK